MQDARQLLFSAITREVFRTNKDEPVLALYGKRQPWIFDFRRILLKPIYLKALQTLFAETFQNEGPFQIGGIESAALPLITAYTLALSETHPETTGFFIRKSRKKTDLARMIEGTLTEQGIILVDDILNSGNSLMRQVTVLESLGKKVSAVFVIVRYRNHEVYRFFHDRGIKVKALFCLDDFSATLPVRNLTDLKHSPAPNPFTLHWCFKAPDPNYFYVIPKSAPALDERALYFGSDNGTFWALDQETGETLWSYKVSIQVSGKAIFSTPALFEDLVYFGAYDGNLYALNKHTGKRAWVFMDADWIGSSPTVAHDLGIVYIGLEFSTPTHKGGIAALNARTGEKIWDHHLPLYVHATPTYSSKHQLVMIGGNDGTISALDARSGALRWSFQSHAEVRAALALSENQDLIAFGSHDSYLYVLETQTGRVVHTHKTKEAIYATPLIHGDLIFIPSLDKQLYAINLLSGQVAWTFATGGRIFASPTLVDGKLYIGSNDARLYELDPVTGAQTGVLQVTERIVNALAYNPVSKKFYLPTFANEIYCMSRSTHHPSNHSS